MMGLITGHYSIIRGVSSETEYGDEVESTDVVYTNIPGSVIEKSRTVYDPQSGRVATLRKLTGRFKFGTDIQDGDRIKDEKTEKVWVVSAVYEGTSFVAKPDLILDLVTAS